MLLTVILVALCVHAALAQQGDGVDTPIMLETEPRPGMTVKVYSKGSQLTSASVASSRLFRAYKARYKGVDYLLAVTLDPLLFPSDGSGVEVIVQLVETQDLDFVSPEGLRIGETYARIKELTAVEENSFYFECIILPSGWKACLNPYRFSFMPDKETLSDDKYTISRFWR